MGLSHLVAESVHDNVYVRQMMVLVMMCIIIATCMCIYIGEYCVL